MSRNICLSPLGTDTSNIIFNPKTISVFLKPFQKFLNEADANKSNVKKIINLYYVPLDIRTLTFEVLTIPQEDNSFVTRVVTDQFCANGQGNTEEEALQDISEAINLLLEEEQNPSGEVPWPIDYQ